MKVPAEHRLMYCLLESHSLLCNYFPVVTLRNWPTFPQVYVNGELIGGSDVLLQMHQNGK